MRMHPRYVERQHKRVLHDEPVCDKPARAREAQRRTQLTPPTDGVLAVLRLAQKSLGEYGTTCRGRGELTNHDDECLPRISSDAPH